MKEYQKQFIPNINPKPGYEKFAKSEFDQTAYLPSLNSDKQSIVLEAERIIREKVNALDW